MWGGPGGAVCRGWGGLLGWLWAMHANPAGPERKRGRVIDERRGMVRLKAELGLAKTPHTVEEKNADCHGLVCGQQPRAGSPLGRLSAAHDDERGADAGIQRKPGFMQCEFNASHRGFVLTHVSPARCVGLFACPRLCRTLNICSICAQPR